MWSKKIHEMAAEQLGEAGQEKLPAHAFPGGYPLYYLDDENCTLCPDCATKDRLDEFNTVTEWSINEEDDTLFCEECNKRIENAWGDDDWDMEPDLEDLNESY